MCGFCGGLCAAVFFCWEQWLPGVFVGPPSIYFQEKASKWTSYNALFVKVVQQWPFILKSVSPQACNFTFSILCHMWKWQPTCILLENQIITCLSYRRQWGLQCSLCSLQGMWCIHRCMWPRQRVGARRRWWWCLQDSGFVASLLRF